MAEQSMRKRAVHDHQKEQRRQRILETAWQLFQQTRYESLTMAEIAEAAGLAKGTIFLYFKTKEGLFLSLLEQQLLEWFAAVNAGLQSITRRGEEAVPEVVAVICAQLNVRPGLTRLLAIVHTMLEHNVTLEEIAHFKYMLKEQFARTGALLEQCLPFLAPGQGAHLLLQCDALVIGLWHLADAAPPVREVLQQPELRAFELTFASELTIALQALITGLARTTPDATGRAFD